MKPVLFLSLAEVGYAAMGGAFSTGPVNSGNFIREAQSTLVVPATPNPIVGLLSLWVGMGTSAGDLIQALTENYPNNGGTGVCDNLNDHWCALTYTLKPSGDPATGALNVINAGDRVTSHCWYIRALLSRSSINSNIDVYNDATGQYDQSVLVNGVVVSTVSTTSGQAQGFGTAEECSVLPCGVVPSHQWLDTTIILDQAYPGYVDTKGIGSADATEFSSSDGGKTWHVDTITIHEWNNTSL
ncbi:unnamed protein product [Clonostachys rosea]|uniref:Uncharacterized protein n=1 Tax=Bionectria ochroleuca TaxID=29856 RepID=A0ABY6TW47_BIOOC|nr:unnamed protein product [Clonostachys rosea]